MRLVAEDPGAELSGKVSYEEKQCLNESQVDPILSCLGFPIMHHLWRMTMPQLVTVFSDCTDQIQPQSATTHS